LDSGSGLSGESPRATQCRVAAANVRLTGIDNGLRDGSNCGVGVVTSSSRNGFAGASITTEEPRERSNRLVPDLCIAIRGQNLGEISYYLGHEDIFVTARFARETVKSTLADRRHGIVQGTTKSIRRNVACVMIKQEQAEPAHAHIRVAQCGQLNSRDRNLLAEPRLPFLRKRRPFMDKITRDFEGPFASSHSVRPCGYVAEAL
jgi:hypothetical protein